MKKSKIASRICIGLAFAVTTQTVFANRIGALHWTVPTLTVVNQANCSVQVVVWKVGCATGGEYKWGTTCINSTVAANSTTTVTGWKADLIGGTFDGIKYIVNGQSVMSESPGPHNHTTVTIPSNVC